MSTQSKELRAAYFQTNGNNYPPASWWIVIFTKRIDSFFNRLAFLRPLAKFRFAVFWSDYYQIYYFISPATPCSQYLFCFPSGQRTLVFALLRRHCSLQYANNISPPRNTQKERNLNKIKADERPLFICCRFFRDTYRGAKACPRLPVPTWSPFCRSCNRGLWKFRRGAKTCPIPQCMQGPSNQ